MPKRTLRRFIPLLAIGALVLAIAPVYASAWGGGDDDRNRPSEAVSYINPDTGAAAANPDVNQNSSCFSPDRYDMQRISDSGTVNRYVHNDACFFGSWSGSWSYGSGQQKVDGPASFDSSGVGYISACPDPDGVGPKVAVLSDRNGDGRADLCFQSGYQDRGTIGVADVSGDFEFHARLNNNNQNMAGRQSVTWCYDANRDGCSDEYRLKDRIAIDWVR